MKLGPKCLVCKEHVTDEKTIQCDVCGGAIHDRCAVYYQTFECLECGDETWIGAAEF